MVLKRIGIIKDIAETYGESAIVEIFDAIKAGILPSNAVDPVDAVLSVIDEPVDYFLEESLANHHIVVLGNYVQEFSEFFEFVKH